MKGRGGVQLRQQLAEEQTGPGGGRGGGGGRAVGQPFSPGGKRG